MEGIISMPLGQVVDFCMAFNERQKEAENAEKASSEKKNKPTGNKYRLATQEEIDAYFR